MFAIIFPFLITKEPFSSQGQTLSWASHSAVNIGKCWYLKCLCWNIIWPIEVKPNTLYLVLYFRNLSITLIPVCQGFFGSSLLCFDLISTPAYFRPWIYSAAHPCSPISFRHFIFVWPSKRLVPFFSHQSFQQSSLGPYSSGYSPLPEDLPSRQRMLIQQWCCVCDLV